MAYKPIPTPRLEQATIITKKFRDIRGVDLTEQFCDDRHSPDMNGMYRDWTANGRNCIVMMPGFRLIGDIIPSYPYANGQNWVYNIWKEPQNGKILVHCGTKLFEWTNFKDCNNTDNAENVPRAVFKVIYQYMEDTPSKSVIFNEKLYIVNGTKYLVYYDDVVKNVDEYTQTMGSNIETAYIPTTYYGRTYLGGGTQYQQRNILTPYFKNTARGDGEHAVFQLSEYNLTAVPEVRVNGVTLISGTDYYVSLNTGKVTFQYGHIPPAPSTPGADNIEFLISKKMGENADFKDKSSIATFDNRVFISSKNRIWWSGADDATYFGELNYTIDGEENVAIKDLINIGSNRLCALKGNTAQDGIIYYHSPLMTNEDYIPKTYPAEASIAGKGCVNSYCSGVLRDDPLFLTAEGLKGISKLSVGLERSIEHRSSYVDTKMCEEKEFIFSTSGGGIVGIEREGFDQHVTCTVWRGYFIALFSSGNMYMADSRMKTVMPDSQNTEYEWFKTSNIGYYTGQEAVEVDANTDLTLGEIQNRIDEADTEEDRIKWQVTLENANTVIEQRGGTFVNPTFVTEIDDQLYFATSSGKIFKFNADMVKNTDTGELKVNAFNNNGRKINAYYTTPFHDYGAFNMLKKFEKKGNVLHTQSFRSGWVKPSVRTNKSYWRDYNKVNTGYFDYGDWDYGDFTYNCFDQVSIAFRKLKEKKWQIAQIKLENGKINSGFGVYELDIRVRYLKLVKK